MKDQSKLMPGKGLSSGGGRSGMKAGDSRRWSGVVGLAFLLVAGVWVSTYFRAEARVRRATARVVRGVEKTGEESPVALGLAANRLGANLSVDAELELEEVGRLTQGRTETVQLFAHIRSAMERIAVDHPRLAVETVRRGEVRAVVQATCRFVSTGGEVTEGRGTADLLWVKGEDGWQIRRARLRAEDGLVLPAGWL